MKSDVSNNGKEWKLKCKKTKGNKNSHGPQFKAAYFTSTL
jgi:hypothetical protein